MIIYELIYKIYMMKKEHFMILTCLRIIILLAILFKLYYLLQLNYYFLLFIL